MRRYISYLILLVMTVCAGGAALLSWHQAHMSSITIFDCSRDGTLIAPKELVLSCADANTLAKGLTWNNWGGATATATGIASWNDCTPTCVAGTWRSAPVSIWAYRIRDDHYTRVNGTNKALFGGGPFDAMAYPPTN